MLSCVSANMHSCHERKGLCVCAGFSTLQDSTYLQYFPEGPCKSMVYEYQKLAAQDIRFDLRLADACVDDRNKFCGNVQPVRAQPGGLLGVCSSCAKRRSPVTVLDDSSCHQQCHTNVA